jgi:hypothetical protein
MTVSTLKALLKGFPDDQEFSVTISSYDDDNDSILTYDVGIGENEFGELTLKVNGF